jgi:tetraacyldisaccharide 4'-kinase
MGVHVNGAGLYLAPFHALPAALYYLVQKVRAEAFDRGLLASEKASVPVVSVGNILIGGSGKTPFTMYVCELLRAQGLNPAVVSRGYGGRFRGQYLVVSRGDSQPPVVGPSECGDEPYLIARRLPQTPVVVGRRRIHPVCAAGELFRSDVVVLDDGFQHLALQRDVDIALIEGSEDRMFPLGRLREPVSALWRADIGVIVGGDAELPSGVKRYLRQVPIFRCRQAAVGLHKGFSGPLMLPHQFANQEVVLASAIAEPRRFRAVADHLEWHVAVHFVFRDHHWMTDSELRTILRRAGSAPVVVTEKDWVKLPEWSKESDRIWALRIAVAVDDEKAFTKTLMNFFSK